MSKLNRLGQKKAKRKEQLRRQKVQLAPPVADPARVFPYLAQTEPRPGISLAVIPEPAKGSRTLLDGGGQGHPLMFGHDADAPDYLCGSCGYRLLTSIKLSDMKGLKDAVAVCPECGSFNDLASQSGAGELPALAAPASE